MCLTANIANANIVPAFEQLKMNSENYNAQTRATEMGGEARYFLPHFLRHTLLIESRQLFRGQVDRGRGKQD